VFHLPIQAGSCHGGYHTSTYEFIKETGYVPYDTCQPYIACSVDSTEGFCSLIDTTCKASNICKTCDTFGGMGGACSEIDYFPNATVAEYGSIEFDERVVSKIMTEIFVRGPVAATINAEPIVKYQGGIFTDDSHSQMTNHIVSIVGWGTDEETGTKYWIVRNSWGQYWGEMGYMRLELGKNLLGIEGEVSVEECPVQCSIF
jgi:cathepsin X